LDDDIIKITTKQTLIMIPWTQTQIKKKNYSEL